VEQTLNALLDAEADALCGAKRYERNPERIDTRAGHWTPGSALSVPRKKQDASLRDRAKLQ
jgi:transposase-like protein